MRVGQLFELSSIVLFLNSIKLFNVMQKIQTRCFKFLVFWFYSVVSSRLIIRKVLVDYLAFSKLAFCCLYIDAAPTF